MSSPRSLRRGPASRPKLIRLKGYTPSWDLGKIREPALDQAVETELQKCLTDIQGEFDMA
jgi:hypothetical protein